MGLSQSAASFYGLCFSYCLQVLSVSPCPDFPASVQVSRKPRREWQIPGTGVTGPCGNFQLFEVCSCDILFPETMRVSE